MRGLVMAAIAAAATAAAPGAATADGNTHADVFATYSPFAAFDLPADGHGPSEKGIVELGVGADAYRRVSPRWELALGARYDVGLGDEDNGHFLSVPATARLVLAAGRHEACISAAVGVGLGIVGDLMTLGPTAEVGVGYRFRTAGGNAVFGAAGLRVEALAEQNADPSSYVAGGTMLNGQFPYVRIGMSWR